MNAEYCTVCDGEEMDLSTEEPCEHCDGTGIEPIDDILYSYNQNVLNGNIVLNNGGAGIKLSKRDNIIRVLDICGKCNGSGEGQYDGSCCPSCKGTGME